MSSKAAEKSYELIYSKPYLKNQISRALEEQNDEQHTELSESINIDKIQLFINELIALIYELSHEVGFKKHEDFPVKYLLKITFDDFNKFSNCNLNNIIIIGILIKLNYFSDILIMEFFQVLLKYKQLNKIKILLHLLGEAINDETLIYDDIKNTLLEILKRRKINLPIYPENFEWKIIFELTDSLDRRLESFDVVKEDLSSLETFTAKKEISVTDRIDRNVIEDTSNKKQDNDKKRLIYLIIKSSGTSDEIVHKILNLSIKLYEEKLSVMETIIHNCSEEKLYSKLYENIIIKLCDVGKEWEKCLEQCFEMFYSKYIEEEELFSNLSHIKYLSKLFARLLSEDCLDFKVLRVVKINSRDTTERKRVFLKFLFKETVMDMSLEDTTKIMLKNKKLKPYLKDSIFPSIENAKDMIYSINFFTAIDLGALTVNMRKELNKNKDNIEKQNASRKRQLESASAETKGMEKCQR